MKIRFSPVALFAALLVVGCGKKDSAPATVAQAAAQPAGSSPAATAAATGSPAATATTPAAAPTAAPKSGSGSTAAAPAASANARVIEITANDQMKFSLATIEAKPGEELKVVLKNIGTLPKEAMGHNWVLLTAGTDVMGFAAASMTAKDNNYVAPSMKDKVIAATPVIGPKQTAEVTFKVPAAGEYPFLCSFPGHAALMKGTLIAK